MKFRQGFVSNSSSSSFILGVEDAKDSLFKFLCKDETYSRLSDKIENLSNDYEYIINLIEYFNDSAAVKEEIINMKDSHNIYYVDFNKWDSDFTKMIFDLEKNGQLKIINYEVG